MKQSNKQLYLKKEAYEMFKKFKDMTTYTNSEGLIALLTKKPAPTHNKKTIINLELKKIKIICNNLLEYFETLTNSKNIKHNAGYKIALKLQCLIDKIEGSQHE
jgi:hypothetical protein